MVICDSKKCIRPARVQVEPEPLPPEGPVLVRRVCVFHSRRLVRQWRLNARAQGVSRSIVSRLLDGDGGLVPGAMLVLHDVSEEELNRRRAG